MMTENMGRALGLGIKARKILHHLVSTVAFRWLATSGIVISDPSGCKCAVLVTTNVELHGARVCPVACEILISIMRKWQHSSVPGVGNSDARQSHSRRNRPRSR